MLDLTIRRRSEPRPKFAFLKCCRHLYLSKSRSKSRGLRVLVGRYPTKTMLVKLFKQLRTHFISSTGDSEECSNFVLGARTCRDIRCGSVLHDQRRSDRANVSLEGKWPGRCRNDEPFAGEAFRCISWSPRKMVNITLLPT